MGITNGRQAIITLKVQVVPLWRPHAAGFPYRFITSQTEDCTVIKHQCLHYVFLSALMTVHLSDSRLLTSGHRSVLLWAFWVFDVLNVVLWSGSNAHQHHSVVQLAVFYIFFCVMLYYSISRCSISQHSLLSYLNAVYYIILQRIMSCKHFKVSFIL